MPCHTVDLGGGQRALVCTSGRRGRRCTYCRRPADRLCDARRKAGTCDAPMCGGCSFRPAGTEDDYCRDHLPAGAALAEQVPRVGGRR